MPKSRNKRKKTQRKPLRPKAPARLDKLSLPRTSSPAEEGDGASEEKRSALYSLCVANDAEGLFRLVSYSPLLLGAWLVNGFVLAEPVAFVLLITALLFAHYNELVRRRDDIPFRENLHFVFYALAAACVFGLHAVTNNLVLTALVAGLVLITVLSEQLRPDSPRGILLLAGSVLVRLSLFGVVGVASQIFRTPEQTAWQFVVLGMVQGMILAASIVTRYAEVFFSVGWRRTREVVARDGTTVKRPGSVSQLYSLLLLSGPAAAVALVPLGYLPASFLLCAALVFFIAKLAEAFFKEQAPEQLIAIRTVHLAGLAVLVVGISALLARLGFV